MQFPRIVQVLVMHALRFRRSWKRQSPLYVGQRETGMLGNTLIVEPAASSNRKILIAETSDC